MKEILTKNQWVPWFKIKTTVQTHTELKSDFDTITKMHKKTIIFRAISYKIHILKLLKPGVSLDVDFSKIVRKEYNYIYTGENVDVQSLRLHYKTAYYMRNVVGWNRSRATKGLVNTLTETWNQLFGQEKDPEPQLPLRQYPSVVLNRSTVDVASGEGGKAQEFFDYLTNPVADMMRIELEILGDPAYICQDIYTPLNGKGETGASTKTEFDEQLHSFNAEQFNPLIFVRYRMPDDIDEKEGTMFSKKKYRKENLFFNGAYQVVRVDSKFDNGQFLQTLTCVRFNNQSGEGLPPILVSSANKDVQWVPKKKIDNIIKKEPVISTDAYS